MTTTSGKRWRRLRFLAEALHRRMIVPTPRLLVILVGLAVIAVLASLIKLGWFVIWGGGILLLVLSAIDVASLPRRRDLRAVRELPDRAELRVPFEVKIRLESSQPLDIAISLIDVLPTDADVLERPLHGLWQGHASESVYTTSLAKRGKFAWGALYVRLRGTLGLWEKMWIHDEEQMVRVFPDLSGLRGVLSSLQQHLTLDGKRVYKRQQGGTELQGIREYSPDDDPRLINWRASARSGQMMANVFQPERGKVVMIAVDCGRMMGIELKDRTRLDAALSAALTLAAVALKQGDKVGMLAFSNEVKSYVAPATGLAHLQSIIEASFSLQPDFVEASYSVAIQYLLRVQKRRSLTVLFSDLEHTMFDADSKPLLVRMKKQHDILLLSIQDEVLRQWSRVHTTNRQAAYVKSAAHRQMLQRRKYLKELAPYGIEAIDVAAEDMAHASISRYLERKGRDQL